ncbi:MAG: cytochrome c, partial [Bryobacterales bacterium]|nr:cytochrome c [Bryobacterales bacterium]
MKGICVFLIAAVAAMAAPEVTFNRDVLPILQKNCQSCHRPGEIGPISLLTYSEARPWAKAIKAAVLTKKMPPWFADPRYGHFANDRSLSAHDVETLSAWADVGAPEGNPKD